MNKVITFLMLVFIGSTANAVAASAENEVLWLDSYEQAVNQSKETQKPLILFFTGSDWCVWCNKLEKEVFYSKDFAQASAGKFIFLRLDFPLNHSLSPAITSQNKELQKKYDVRSFPTILILDSHQRQIGITGYRPGGGQSYSAHLDKIVSDYSSYQQRLEGLEKKKLTSQELKELFTKAKELGRLSESLSIIEAGVKSDDNRFFLIEHYRVLADEGQIFDEKTVRLKKQILNLDPLNKNFTHYQIAVIDFETACQEMEKENFSPEITVAPLVNYIEKFGKQDPDHLWKLEMLISQIYFERGKIQDALKHAEASYRSAPENSKEDIAIAIKNIQSQSRL